MFQHNHYTHTLIIWSLIQLHRKFRLGSFTTEDEMVGWHHQLNGHESEQALGVADEQGTLACCSPWGRKELDTAEQLNWTELMCVCVCVCVCIYTKWSEVKVTQLCPTLCDPMGYTVLGILQARVPEWVAFSFPREFSQPRFPTLQADSLPAEPPGKPIYNILNFKSLIICYIQLKTGISIDSL